MVKTKRFLRTISLYVLALFVLVAAAGCSSLKKDDPAMNPEASFNKANEYIEKGRFVSAREVLEEIQAKDVTRKFALLAQIRIADTYFEDGSYEEAAVEYQNFLETHSFHKYSSYAQYKLAMCYYMRIKTVDVSYSWAMKALEEFNKLLYRYPRNPYMEIVESRMKTCRRVLAEYEFYVGEFYFKKGAWKAAAMRFERLIEDHAGSKKVPEATYYLALSYGNAGKRDEAVEVLRSLVNRYPTTQLAHDARDKIADFSRPALILKK